MALYTAVATRIARLRDLSRRIPEALYTVELSQDAWRVLYTYFGSALLGAIVGPQARWHAWGPHVVVRLAGS